MRQGPYVPFTPEDNQQLRHPTRLVVELGWHPTRRAWVWNYASRASTDDQHMLRDSRADYGGGPSDRTLRRRRARTGALLQRLGDLRNAPAFEGLEVGSRAWVSRAQRLLREQGS
ncbi:MAG: hypothetical protein F4X54_02770 [Chloroflexi bacterium]|nr:hypothetical protein [Chloroflexota bacterium]MYB83668.1 hypothetical protein [Chloroflexota bacterium]